MKSLNFKRKENAQLRYLEEKVTGKKRSRFNWDRVVYLSILALIIFFVLRYFFLSNFYISANGQVIFDNVDISQTEDIRIEKFYFNEGDNIEVGDTLFSYLIEDPAFAIEVDPSANNGNESNWTEREMYSLQKSIDLNNSQIRGDRQLLASYKSQLGQLENEVILGAANERDLQNLEYQISKLETSISLTQSENGVLNKQLGALQSGANMSVDELSASPQEFSPYRVYVSPIDGYISRIYKEPFEVALKSEIIIKVHQADSVHIKGYFEQKDLKYVQVDDHINILFPDGQESEGVIDRFYSSTVIMPEEFQKKFEPVKRTIAVDIKPAEGSDLDLWKRYYKLSVELTKRTF
ncbi:MAG: multidrug resistance efflux pump [Crocinitomix sp.]|jgi:multidrug resistance efflux pump